MVLCETLGRGINNSETYCLIETYVKDDVFVNNDDEATFNHSTPLTSLDFEASML